MWSLWNLPLLLNGAAHTQPRELFSRPSTEVIHLPIASLPLVVSQSTCVRRALAEGRVMDGDPATVEAKLLGEQDEIEFALGEDYFERRDEL